MLKLTYYQLLQAVRMPLTFLWTLGLPTILYLVFSYSQTEAVLLLGYIVFSSYLYGSTLQLIDQRESGFLKTIIQSRRSMFNHLCSIYLANLVVILLSVTVYLALVLKSDFVQLAPGYLLAVSAVSPLVFFTCQTLTLLKLKNTDISTLCSMMLMLFTLLSFSSLDVMGFELNSLNPIYSINAFVNIVQNGSFALTDLLPFLCLSVIGLITTAKMNIQSYEGR
ncbi:hypothetical protein [Salinivibrio kushneri]|uniref:hypothetical protein n=1 Tax=Salinivibrio kushneri TaxID=1908198 RepID=UPI000987630F|nr:hypothetical protein [Salinivibrio kushneri]OOE46020.1 hypothetical protein BZG10_14090 [Salinivibrio kushneri]OOE51972.1 hypothetical protein BZG11_05720 [Salinivibrio kushneri]OOE59585.1 hypothetical protein BZG18_13105 [Salinivibrio kushneri]